MNKYKFLALLLISISSFLVGSSVKAETYNNTSFSIAAPMSQPFVFTDKTGNPQGFLVEFFDLVKSQVGIEVNISVLPWSRAMMEVKKGNIDALMPTIYTKERANSLVYPKESLVVFNTVLLKRKEDSYVLNNLEKVDPKLIFAKIRAMSMGSIFDDAEKSGKINVIEVRDFDHAIQMLAKNRIDLVGCIDYIALSSLKRLNLLNDIDIVRFTDKVEPAYLAFSNTFSKKQDVNKLMSAINQVKKTDKYQELVTKFLGL